MHNTLYNVKSITGKVRNGNEDSVRVEFNNFGDQIFILADGMGGHNAGDVASQMACKIIGDGFLKLTERPNYKKFLNEVIYEANEEIYIRAILDPNCSKMGTTLSILILSQKEVFTGHIGDSRIYYMNSKKIMQITKDHTLVRAMVDAGNIEEGQEKYSKYKNVLLQALGTSKKVTIELNQFKCPSKFKFLICSDGLTGEVTDKNIYNCMNQDKPLESRVEQLVTYANEIDGSDNISVIAIENRSDE